MLACVLELTAGGTQGTLPFSGLNNPEGVAVDESGNVFVAGVNTMRVVELPADGTQVTLLFSGLNNPQGMAVDRSGNVFVADSNNSQGLVELTPSVPLGSVAFRARVGAGGVVGRGDIA